MDIKGMISEIRTASQPLQGFCDYAVENIQAISADERAELLVAIKAEVPTTVEEAGAYAMVIYVLERIDSFDEG